MENDNSDCLLTDEASDVVDSLRHAVKCFDWAATDPSALKWTFLALHSALQGACVCHLVTSAQPLGVVTDKNAKEWLEYFEKRRSTGMAKIPSTHLLDFVGLLKNVRKENSSGDGGHHAPIEISDNEIEWLKRLHKDIRNQFIHFSPMGWSIDMSGMDDFARIVVRIIRAIHEANYAFRHLDPEQKSDLQAQLEKLS